MSRFLVSLKLQSSVVSPEQSLIWLFLYSYGQNPQTSSKPTLPSRQAAVSPTQLALNANVHTGSCALTHAGVNKSLTAEQYNRKNLNQHQTQYWQRASAVRRWLWSYRVRHAWGFHLSYAGGCKQAELNRAIRVILWGLIAQIEELTLLGQTLASPKWI